MFNYNFDTLLKRTLLLEPFALCTLCGFDTPINNTLSFPAVQSIERYIRKSDMVWRTWFKCVAQVMLLISHHPSSQAYQP